MISIDSSRFDLRLELSQVELNAKLPTAAFEVKVPPSADPITIQELRRSGPLSGE
jgi:outer membrane lipoprotein-sorting protein